jgi:hypothetical protein
MCAAGEIVISGKHTSTQWGMQEEGLYKFHVDLTHYFLLFLSHQINLFYV